jgi:nucleoside 2-deoxyribosyltransferase
MGFTETGRRYYGDVYIPALASRVVIVDPWSLHGGASAPDVREPAEQHAFYEQLGERNATAIRSCEILIADLDGQELDSGTAAEVGYAAGLGLLCLGLRTDLRQSGEAGVQVNAQVAFFIHASGGVIARSLAELLAVLDELRPPRDPTPAG